MRTEYDKKTMQFPREYNGQFADNDVFIDCIKGVKVFYFGKSILQCYVSSLQRGHNLIKAIKESFHEDIIFDIEESDSECLFKFHVKYMEQLEPILKPKTNGASISPFSTKNLPRNKAYKIPDEELKLYKNLVAKLDQKQLIGIVHSTNSFLKSLINKKMSWEDIKADMAFKGLKNKEYIHSIGKWNDYVKYLEKELC